MEQLQQNYIKKPTFPLNTENVSSVARELAIHKRVPASIYRGLGDR